MDNPRHNLLEVSIDNLESNPIVDYSDGDVVIIDDVGDLKELSPLYAKMNFIILCTQGRIQFDINGSSITLYQNEVLLSAPNVVLDNYLISIDFKCKILCLSDQIIQGLLRGRIDMWNMAVYIKKTNIIRLPETEQEQFAYYYALIKFKMEHPERPFNQAAVQSIIRALLLDVCALVEDNEKETRDPEVSRGRVLFNKFLKKLLATPVKRQAVGHYASDLAVSPKYLNMVCKKYSQKSASHWIEQYVMEDIRYYLCQTDLSIKEIATQLGFNSMSFFGSYVRKHFGVSPSTYRKQNL